MAIRKSKKTFDVQTFTAKVNQMLRESTCEPEARQGMIVVLEHVLRETNNYCGFTYLRENEVPEGHMAGVHFVNGLSDFNYTDKTRVEYFVR